MGDDDDAAGGADDVAHDGEQRLVDVPRRARAAVAQTEQSRKAAGERQGRQEATDERRLTAEQYQSKVQELAGQLRTLLPSATPQMVAQMAVHQVQASGFWVGTVVKNGGGRPEQGLDREQRRELRLKRQLQTTQRLKQERNRRDRWQAYRSELRQAEQELQAEQKAAEQLTELVQVQIKHWATQLAQLSREDEEDESGGEGDDDGRPPGEHGAQQASGAGDWQQPRRTAAGGMATPPGPVATASAWAALAGQYGEDERAQLAAEGGDARMDAAPGAERAGDKRSLEEEAPAAAALRPRLRRDDGEVGAASSSAVAGRAGTLDMDAGMGAGPRADDADPLRTPRAASSSSSSAGSDGSHSRAGSRRAGRRATAAAAAEGKVVLDSACKEAIDAAREQATREAAAKAATRGGARTRTGGIRRAAEAIASDHPAMAEAVATAEAAAASKEAASRAAAAAGPAAAEVEALAAPPSG